MTRRWRQRIENGWEGYSLSTATWQGHLKIGLTALLLLWQFRYKKMLSALGKDIKVLSLCLSENAQLWKDILQVHFDLPFFFFCSNWLSITQCSTAAAITALEMGPPRLLKITMQQAEVTNLPRIGKDGNVIYPAFQLNIATAVEPDRRGQPLLPDLCIILVSWLPELMYQRGKLTIVVKLTNEDNVTFKISSMVSLQYNDNISRSCNF